MRIFKKAFTLVELLVVIAILGVLATVGIISYSSFKEKAAISNDITLVRQVNDILIDEEASGNVPTNMYEAKEMLLTKQYGIDISAPKISTRGYYLGYDVKQNRVVLLSSLTSTKAIEAPTNYTMENAYDVFVSLGKYDNSCIFSQYLNKDATDVSVTTDKGFDAGDCKTLTSVTYTNNSNAKDVVLRTNSASTDLTINAPLDNVNHYGTAGLVTITQVATTSYYENGVVSFIEFNIGRIVLTKTSDVEIINVSKKSDNHTYNNPIIADGGVLEENMPEIISRDQVDVIDPSGKTPLVQVQKLDTLGNVIGGTEQVYAYVNGDAGTTEKTSLQNTTISSVLGLIVLDGGSKAGEKAYSVDQKSAVSKDVIQTKIDEEVTSTNPDVSYVARIGLQGYPTLALAVSFAKYKETIVLLDDVSENITFNYSVKEITIDLNGHTWSSTGSTIYMTYYGKNLTITGKEGSILTTTSSNPIYIYDGTSNKVTFSSDFAGTVEKTTKVNSGKGSVYAYGGYFASMSNIKITDDYIGNTEARQGYTKVELVNANNAPVCTVVGETTTYYANINKAFAGAVNGGTIKMLKDYTATNTPGTYYPTAPVTFDLNGHTFNLGSYTSFAYLYQNTLTVTDSVGIGLLTSNSNASPFKLYNDANLVVTNLKCNTSKITIVTCDSATATGNVTLNNVTAKAASVLSTGTATFTNCTFANQATITNAACVINGGEYPTLAVQLSKQASTSLTITSGTFGYINFADGCTISITTCILDEELSDEDDVAYNINELSANYSATDNGDGTWTLTPKN